jgi:nitroreductase/dihydropteridine reductase
MEGFDPATLDIILKLNEKGLKSCILLPVGYRDTEKDWLVKLPKVRNSKADFITTID